MKKVLMAVVCSTMMFAAFNANGQSSHLDKKFAWGIKLGANVSSINYKTPSIDTSGAPETYDMGLGFNAALVMEWRINRLFGLAIEPGYSLERATLDYEVEILREETEFESSINANFINIPILLKVYPFKGLYLQAGPQLGFNIGTSTKTEVRRNGVLKTNETFDWKSGDGYNVFALGINFGLGWDFGHFFVDARYNLGITNFHSQMANNPLDRDIKNSNFSLNVGLKF
ncbi:MAG: PorT family protein [Bacteroidales bacterium]|jgi:hypothetical protein|nr:PorT family protein [Bacteroidales bacterium]